MLNVARFRPTNRGPLNRAGHPALRRTRGTAGGVVAAWYESAAYDDLVAGADLNNDRYFLPDLGAEMFVDPLFDDPAQWFATAHWTYTGGVATKIAGSGTTVQGARSLATEIGKLYRIDFECITRTSGSGSIRAAIGGAQTAFTPISSGQTLTFYLVATTTGTPYIESDSALAGTFGRYSIKEVSLSKVSGKYPRRSATFDEFFAYTSAAHEARTFTDQDGVLKNTDWGSNYIADTRTSNAVVGSAANGGTVWEGLQGVSNGLTVEVVGFGVIDGREYVDVKLSGTATATIGGTPYHPIGTSVTVNPVESAPSQAWTYSLEVALIAGSFSNVSSLALSMDARNTAGSAIEFDPGSTNILGAGATLSTYSRSRTFASTSTITRCVPCIRTGFSSGANINFTLRLARPRLQKGLLFSGNFVATSGTAIPRAANGDTNKPRWTWANGKRQLRLENAGTNLLTASTDLQNAAWSVTTGALRVPNDALAPDGTMTAARITSDGTSIASLRRTAAVTTAASTTHSSSFFLKRMSGSDWWCVSFFDTAGSGNQVRGTFNIATGALGQASVAASGVLAAVPIAVQAFGNGWYRCTISGHNGTATANNIQVYPCVSDADVSRALGEGWVWGPQLEANAFSSDYIPTTTAAVNRAIETCGFSPLVLAIFQRAAASSVVRADLTALTVNSRRYLGGDGGAAFIFANRATGPSWLGAFNGTATLNGQLGGGGSTDNAVGVATAFDATGRALCGNGGTVTTDANQPGGRSALYLGRSATVTATDYGDGFYDFVGFGPERWNDNTLKAQAVAA